MSGERSPGTRPKRVNGRVTIDKDVFDEMYSLRNPLPDKHDYEALAQYYKSKSYAYNELQKTINERYREKYYRYLEKFNRINQPEAIREDEWTSIMIGEKTRADLEGVFSRYRVFAGENRPGVTYHDLDDYLKQWALRFIYNDILSVRDFPDDLLTAFTIDEPETHLGYIKKAIETSENSGRPVSLRLRASTRNLLDRMRDMTFLETYDQAVTYLLDLVRSKKYHMFIEVRESAAKPLAGREHDKYRPGAKSAGMRDEAVLEMPKIRDIDDFIIDYIHLLKVKEIKNKR